MGKRRRKHVDVRKFRSLQGGLLICPACSSNVGEQYHYEDCDYRKQLGERNHRRE